MADAATRRGDGAEDRFRVVFDAHYRVVLAFCLRRTASADDAQDVTSETFAVAWRRLDQLPAVRDEQVSWLLATARRVLANHHRGARRRRALQTRVEVARPDVVAPDDTERAGEVELIRRALAGLSETDREVLQLTVWDELTHDQAGAVLELTASAVSVRVHRARQRLAASLDALRDAPGGDA